MMRTSTQTIEEKWKALKSRSHPVVHMRVDESHPLELYAEFEQPDRPGLVLFCSTKPPEAASLRAVLIEQGRRDDGKWSLRLSLVEPELESVFAGLCRDIVAFTRSGIPEEAAAIALLGRVSRWRALLEREQQGLSSSALRGLMAELLVLEQDVLPRMSELEAVRSWMGPFGTAQDFVLPGGERIEVKSVRHDASEVQINGLDQLDPAGDILRFVVMRMLDTARGSEGAESAPDIVARLGNRLAGHSLAKSEFENRLLMAGWHEHPSHAETVVKVTAIDEFLVDASFPRLIRSEVPAGIVDVNYTVSLPAIVGATSRVKP